MKVVGFLLALFTSWCVSWHFCTPHLALDGWVFRLGWLLTCADKTFFQWAYCICTGGHLLSPSAILYPYFFYIWLSKHWLSHFPLFDFHCAPYLTLKALLLVVHALSQRPKLTQAVPKTVAMNQCICHTDFPFKSRRTSWICSWFLFIIVMWVLES